MALSLDKVGGIHEHALKLRARRLELLAGNIANADTPGFKARDIDFRAALKQAMGGEGPVKLRATHASHINAVAPGDNPYVRYRVPQQPTLDGNTVEMHIEQGEFARNAVEYQASLRFLEGKFKSIINALKGEA